MKHVFVISAYGDSPYLRECLGSLKAQSEPSEILICTSTPSGFLEKTAEESGVPLFVRNGPSGLRADWNFCIETAAARGADFVTIAHQDDFYLPGYAAAVRRKAAPGTALLFSAAENIDSRGEELPGKAERIKRILRFPLLLPGAGSTRYGKRSVLRFGNSIPCPACTYGLAACGAPEKEIFRSDYRFVTDWAAAAELAEGTGSFLYLPEPLVRIRLHSGAETAKAMRDDVRLREEEEMLRRFHSPRIAGLLMRFYRRSSALYGQQVRKTKAKRQPGKH